MMNKIYIWLYDLFLWLNGDEYKPELYVESHFDLCKMSHNILLFFSILLHLITLLGCIHIWFNTQNLVCSTHQYQYSSDPLVDKIWTPDMDNHLRNTYPKTLWVICYIPSLIFCVIFVHWKVIFVNGGLQLTLGNLIIWHIYCMRFQKTNNIFEVLLLFIHI